MHTTWEQSERPQSKTVGAEDWAIQATRFSRWSEDVELLPAPSHTSWRHSGHGRPSCIGPLCHARPETPATTLAITSAGTLGVLSVMHR